MKFRDLTELAWRNLREALLRNSLTTLGIGVGVASLVAMLSLGVGLQEMADQRLSRSGLFDTEDSGNLRVAIPFHAAVQAHCQFAEFHGQSTG